jgi:lysophospholipase L1-like esterase
MLTPVRLLCVSMLGAMLSLPAAEPRVPLEFDGPPRVLALLGDSLTEGGGYHQRLQLYLSTRYPGHGHWVVNLGWNGDTAHGALGRLEAEAIGEEVDTLFIFFGMNDVGRDAYREQSDPPSDQARQGVRDRYQRSLAKLITELEREDRQLILLSPTIYDDRSTGARGAAGERPHLDAELLRFGALARAVAETHGLPWIDLHGPMRAVTDREQAGDPAFSLTVDRIHLNHAGNDLVFATLLAAVAQPSPVWEIVLDADGTVHQQQGATVVDPALGADGSLAFSLEERALPYPGVGDGGGLSLVEGWTPYNRMGLRIAHLAPGGYRLLVDDDDLGTFTADNLARGIDLGLLDTPQLRQAATVWPLVRRKAQADSVQRSLVKVRKALAADGQDADIDWANPDPDLVIAAWERRPASGWNTRMLETIRREAPGWAELRARTTSIRAELQALPPVFHHHYRLVPVAGP